MRQKLRRYWLVALTVGVGILCLALLLFGQNTLTAWIASGFAVLVAVLQFVGMVRDLFRGHIGIDVLAISAIIATVAVGEYWAALVVVLMLSGGEALEDYAADRAGRELNALLRRAPQVAHLAVENEALRDVPVAEVRAGDRLLVRAGEVVPVDGVLESSLGSFDESQLTGESLPVDRVKGEGVLSGAVNGATPVTITASAVAADSQYQRIVQLVSEAAESRAPLVRLADRYAIPFTAVSYVIAGAAWFLSGDPTRFAEVLVVATPCPLLIAAPVAFIAGMSRSSRAGIIVKGAAVLEQLSRARTVAFDKTGTLTHGTPTISEVRPVGELSKSRLLELVASAEQYSVHVVAATLVQEARRRGLSISAATGVQETTGQGVRGNIDGQDVVVGKRAFLETLGIPVNHPPPDSGQMAVYAAVAGRFAGDILMEDPVRDSARDSVSQLARLGIDRVLMVTGDAEATAHTVAEKVGITEVVAECLPQDKVTVIQKIQQRPVIMVGDGVNDAPVLAAADVGIAMGAKGSTAASETADAVIMLDDVSRVVHAVTIGRQTTAVALQAILVGIGLSVALMLVATTGVLPAIVGAGLQEVVDLITILYALRGLQERSDRRLKPTRAPLPHPLPQNVR
ncbi:MAG: heavy metal translocating P-type ATPase [Microbacteriaceae bacterium]